MDKLFRALPANPSEAKRFPLSLGQSGFQFFAEKKEDLDDDDDEIVTLKDMFKKYPHLRQEHKTAISEAVRKRLPDLDFDVDAAKAALQEKTDREKNGDSTELVKQQLERDFKSKEDKYLERIKGLSVEAYAAGDGLDAKLISRLAADQVKGLTLDEALKLPKDELDEIIEDLRAEFPTAFPVVKKEEEDDDPEPGTGTQVPPVKKYNPGSQQQTNKPPKGGEDVEAEMAAILENLNRRNGIKPKTT